jgi:hypothetical protein
MEGLSHPHAALIEKSVRLHIVYDPFWREDELINSRKWYSRQCNGDWEHGFGVDISTIHNPGWSVSIGLHDTAKQEAKFEPVRIDRKPTDWIQYWAEEQKFHIKLWTAKFIRGN